MYTHKCGTDGDELPRKKIAHIAPVKINPQPGPSDTQSAKEKMTISDMSESERLKKRAERFSAHLNKDFSFQEDLGIENVRTGVMRKNRKRKAEAEYNLFQEREEAERAENILLKVEDRIRRRKERERERERKKEHIVITVVSDKAAEHGGLQGRSNRDRDNYQHRDRARRREDERDLDYHSSKRSNIDPHLDKFHDRSYGHDSPSTSPVRHLPLYIGSDDWIHRDQSDDCLRLDPLDLYRNEASDGIHLDALASYTDPRDDQICLDPVDPYSDQPDDRIYMDPLDSFRDPPDDWISMDTADPFRDSRGNRIHTGFRDYDDIPDFSPHGSLDKGIRLDPDGFRESVNSQLEVVHDISTNSLDGRSRIYRMDTNRDQIDIDLRPKSSSQYNIIQEDSLSLVPGTSSRILSDDQLSLGSQHTYNKEAEERLHRATYRNETEGHTFDDRGSEQEPYYLGYQDVRPNCQINPDTAIYTETEIMSRTRTYNPTEQSTAQPVDKDCQVFDYGHGGLQSLQDTSRDCSEGIQDSRHSSDRIQDYSRDRSDRKQNSRDRSDRKQDSQDRLNRRQDSRDHSDRRHDSRARLDRRQDSRDRSDRRQDSRDRSARIQDSRDRSDRIQSSMSSLDRDHTSARHPSDRLEASRHSSNRVQDHRHHSDIPQDSRHSSDRLLDSRSRSDRVQDSRHSSDRLLNSRSRSDRVQDSRHSSDRLLDSRLRSERVQDSRHSSDRLLDSKSRSGRVQDSRHSSNRLLDSRSRSDRVQDSRHSSDRLLDSRSRSGRVQESRHSSDRLLDSRLRSDRVQDSRHSSDRAQDSRHSSDRSQDSRHHSDRVRDSRHHSDREKDSTARHPHSADQNSASSTGDNYHSDRLQDMSTHFHGHPMGDDQFNYGSRIRTDQFGDDQLRLDHSEIVYNQRPSVSRPHGAGDHFDLDLRTGQDCSNYERKSGDDFPDRGYSCVTYRSNQGLHGLGSSSYDRRSRSPDQRRNPRDTQGCIQEDMQECIQEFRQGYTKEFSQGDTHEFKQGEMKELGPKDVQDWKQLNNQEFRQGDTQECWQEDVQEWNQEERMVWPDEGMKCHVPTCETKWFKRYGNLIEHWHTVHSPTVQLSICKTCGKQFLRLKHARDHIKTHQPPASIRTVVRDNCRGYINPGHLTIPLWKGRPPTATTAPAAQETSTAQSTYTTQRVSAAQSAPAAQQMCSAQSAFTTQVMPATQSATTTSRTPAVFSAQRMPTAQSATTTSRNPTAPASSAQAAPLISEPPPVLSLQGQHGMETTKISKQFDIQKRVIWPEEGMTCPVSACDQTWYKRYGKYIDHWLKFHNPTVRIKSCSVCHKQFQRKHVIHARKHILEHQCQATIEDVNVRNIHYRNPTPFHMVQRRKYMSQKSALTSATSSSQLLISTQPDSSSPLHQVDSQKPWM